MKLLSEYFFLFNLMIFPQINLWLVLGKYGEACVLFCDLGSAAGEISAKLIIIYLLKRVVNLVS